jgi:hypothetical protein
MDKIRIYNSECDNYQIITLNDTLWEVIHCNDAQISDAAIRLLEDLEDTKVEELSHYDLPDSLIYKLQEDGYETDLDREEE